MPNYYQFYFINTPFEYDYCEKFISKQEEDDLSIKKFINTREDGWNDVYGDKLSPKGKVL